MRRDSIFYQLFQQYPALVFELLNNPPSNASEYRFDSVAVKESKFEIDGVFLPPETSSQRIVYFCEVQFQKDQRLYERLFSELFLYFYRNRHRFSDWQAVVIYPQRNIEQSETNPYRSLFNSDQVHRIYLDELGDIEQLPIEVALMLLTIADEQIAPDQAKYLIQRTEVETPSLSRVAIIELITTIIAYKFSSLSRREVEKMIGITFEQTQFYQDITEEAREQGREQGRERERGLILRLLNKRFGELPQQMRSRLENLSLEELENLGEAVFDFSTIEELEVRLTQIE